MLRSDLERVIGEAIRKASGKGFGEAVQIIADAVSEADKFVVAPTAPPPPAPSPIPAAIVSSNEELQPIIQATKKAVRDKEWHSTEQIQEIVLREMPGSMSVTPKGANYEIQLKRVIQCSIASPPFVQVAYRPNTTEDVSHPKCFLFTTDPEWNIPAMLKKMKEEAESMYAIRGTPQSRVVNMGPVEGRMVNAGNV